MHLAINGWQFAENSESPASAHLAELLRELSAVQPKHSFSLIHPRCDPPPLFERIASLEIDCGTSTWDRFRFEQWLLSRAAQRLEADLLLFPYPAAPLTSIVPVVVLFTGPSSPGRRGLVERWRWAFGRAGISGARRILTFDDVPVPSVLEQHGGRVDLKAWVGTSFRVLPGEGDRHIRSLYDLEDDYVLCHGLRGTEASALAAVWTWVDGSVGDTVPLVVCGLDGDGVMALNTAAEGMAVEHSMRVLQGVPYNHLPALYRGARALLRPSQTGNLQVFRWALASGVPVVVPHAPHAAAMLGDSAYLVQPGDARALGAAVLTLVVEPQLHKQLKQRGLLRAAGYHKDTRRSAMWRALTSAV
jgi:glycosyltransferase involved in cell wall biosynthesis